MGYPKQLLPYRDTNLIGHVIRQVQQAEIAPIVVVVGAWVRQVAASLPDTVQIVYNAQWSQGMGTSLACGIAYLDPNVAAAMLVLADQPRVDTGLLQRLVATYRQRSCDAVALQYPSGPGVPALVSAQLFGALQHASGEGGAQAILRNPDYRVLTTVQAEATQDVDTPEDYQQIVAKAAQNGHLSPNLHDKYE